jgi:multidrug efflux pump subunit AcrB
MSLAVVAIACLAFSLVEALFILPAHLVGRSRKSDAGGHGLGRLQRAVDARLDRFVQEVYRPTLARALRWPALTLSASVVSLALTSALLVGGWVSYGFFPDFEGDEVEAIVTMPIGAPPEVVEAAVSRIENEARALAEELAAENGGHPVAKHVMVAIGSEPDSHDDFRVGEATPHVGTVQMALVGGEHRGVTSLDVEEQWRARVGPITGAESLVFSGNDLIDLPPIEVVLTSPDRNVLEGAVAALKQRIAGYPGVREISDSLRGGKQELKLHIRPEAEALGITRAELARQVRQGFHGAEVQRVQRGRDDVAVVVRYAANERTSLSDLARTRIRLPGGMEVPFSAVAEADVGRGYAPIERTDRKTAVTVTADVDPDVAEARVVLADLVENALPEVLAAHPGVDFSLEGASRQEAEFTERLARDWVLALFAAYVLLAIPLRSYFQPLLILLAVPFGLVGAILAHLALGLQFSAFSLVGIVALSGVVINDALVLIDRTNRRRAEGASLHEALADAGVTRFRAILLTSLTTFFGLLPLLFERSAQAAWLKPMAASLGFGVLLATVITLVLVPAAYLLLEQGLAQIGWASDRAGAPSEPTQAA